MKGFESLNKEVAVDLIKLVNSISGFTKSKSVSYQTKAGITSFHYVPLDDILSKINDEEGNPYSDSYNCTYYEVDLSYLFEGSVSDDYLTDGKVIVAVEERGRQFDTQYPDYDTISRCGIMEDFGDRNDAVLAMWENVKIGDIPISITIILLASIIFAYCFYTVRKYLKIRQRKNRRKEI